MSIAQQLLPQYDNEMTITRGILAVLPDADWDWRPHPKSTPLGVLGNHVANLGGLVATIVDSPVLDAGAGGRPEDASNVAALLRRWDEAVPVGRKALAGCSDEAMMAEWSFKKGGQVMMAIPRVAAIQTFVLSHMIHHRGQLSVYLRLRDVPLPSIYGPSADTPV